MEKDLFGKAVSKKRSRAEILLSKRDRDTIAARIERIKYLKKVIPIKMGLAGSMETVFVFQEAQAAFVNGHFIATILLAQAFTEKVIQEQMDAKGYPGTTRGLKYMVKYCRDNNLLPSVILDKIDHIRKVRNPFTHLKPADHPYALSRRIFRDIQKGPAEVLESDAKEAISIMVKILFLKVA